MIKPSQKFLLIIQCLITDDCLVPNFNRHLHFNYQNVVTVDEESLFKPHGLNLRPILIIKENNLLDWVSMEESTKNNYAVEDTFPIIMNSLQIPLTRFDIDSRCEKLINSKKGGISAL